MYLTDDTISTEQLQNAIARSPLSKPAVATFLSIYQSAKDFLDDQIFRQIRANVETLINTPLNLRKRLDKAKMGRYVALAELTHRRALPSGFEPLHLLGETTEQLEMDFGDGHDGESEELTDNQSVNQLKEERDRAESQDHACGNHNFRKLQQERDKAQEQAKQAKQQLQEFEAFTQLLLLGRIFHEPPQLNGLEQAPLLKVFGSPTTLDKLHENFRTLRAKHHPDQSPFQAQEAADRFNWLKQAYSVLVENWVRFSPTNQDIPRDRVSKLQNQQLTWEPESFWYWE